MQARPNNILFARYFNAFDETGQQYAGFYRQLGLSIEYSALEVLQEIGAAKIDSYLYSEYSNRYVTDYWASFMTWDKEHKRYNIDPMFYGAFADALCAQINTAENLYQLTQFDWEEIKDLITTTKKYGTHVSTRERENDTTTTGQRQDTQNLQYGQAINTVRTEYGGTSETLTDNYAQHQITNSNAYADQETDVTTTNDKAAFNPVPDTDYSADTKSHTTGKNIKARTDTLTQTDSAHTDTHGTVALEHTDTTTNTAQSHTDTITDTIGQQTTTDTYGTVTDRSNEHTDEITVEGGKGYDNAKLLEIKQQLANINAYKIVGDAIAAVLLRNDWGWC